MNELINEIGIGMIIGLVIGFSMGIIIGKKQKPYSEMNEKEKKIHKIVISTGIILLTIGVIVNLWLFYNW